MFRAMKNYFVVIVSGAIIIAGVVLVVLQWDSRATVTMYGRLTHVNTALLMVCAILFGLLLPCLVRTCLRGSRRIRAARHEKKARQTHREVARLARHVASEQKKR